MGVGTAAKNWHAYGWQAYNWASPPQPADPVSGGVWNTFAATVDPDSTAVATSGKTNYNGQVTVEWGTQPGAYFGRSTPIPVQAGVTFNYRITGQKRKTKYYVNAIANVVLPATANTLANVVNPQYGEVSYTTT